VACPGKGRATYPLFALPSHDSLAHNPSPGARICGEVRLDENVPLEWQAVDHCDELISSNLNVLIDWIISGIVAFQVH
jgi:carbonic anhydrase/acetyltransferase-like protein (isoleucine patch superfamily)